MAIRERLVYAIDVTADGAKSGIAGIKAAVKDAEGGFAKLKAGAQASFDAFRQSNTAQAVAIGGVATMAAKAVEAASDLAESINAVNVSYGDAAESVLRLGENSAESFGLAKSEFNAFAVQFSSFAKNIAQSSGREVADVLNDLTTRVADFASVMNLDLNEAAAVFMSTMSGETEPIRRFGKDVSAAAVELYALENGLIDNKNEMTEAIKVQARYGLLMEQTADTAGDFANTSEGAANSQRILKAEMKDLQAEIGTDLLPAVASLTRGLQNLIKVAEAVHLDDIFDISWAEDVGRTLGTILSPWNTGARQANAEIVKFGEEGQQAFDKFGAAAVASSGSIAEARAKIGLLTDNMHAANLVSQEWAATYGTQREVIDGVRDVILRAAYANDDLTKAQNLVNESIESSLATYREREQQLGDMTRAQNLVNEAIIESQEALREEEAAYRDNVQAMRAKEDAAYSLHDSEYALEQAIHDAVVTLEDETTTLRGARSALEDVTSAADEVALKQVEMAGKTIDTKQGMDIWVQSMLETANTMGGPLRDEMIRYVSQISGIPTSVLTQFDVGMDMDALAAIQRDLDFTARERFVRFSPTGGAGVQNRYARGTNSAKPGLALVGEEGPELVNFKGGESVLDATKTASLASGGSPMMGSPVAQFGDVHFHVSMQGVNDPNGFAEELNRFVRQNGPGTLRRMLGLPAVG